MGPPIRIKGVTGGRDKRGLMKLSFNFFIGGVSAEDALLIALPHVTSLPEVFRSIQDWDVDDQGYTIQADYEGLLGNENEGVCSIDPEWREEPIEAFPELEELMEKYAGFYNSEGRVEFRPQLDDASSGGGGMFDSLTASEGRNPLFGTTTYPVLRLVATRSRIVRTVPRSIYDRVGKIVSSLPTGFKEPPDRQWMYDAPRVRERGDAFELTERWKDVKDLRHLDAIYTLLRRGS